MHFFRKFMLSTPGKILIVLICVAFVISLFIPQIAAQGQKGEAVIVGDQAITAKQLKYRFEKKKEQITAQLGPQMAKFVTEDSVKQELINESLLKQMAQDSGLAISDEQINKVIFAVEDFHDDNGEFSAQRYQEALRNAGRTAVDHRKQIADSLRLAQLSQGFSGSAFVVDKEVEQNYRIQNQKRDFDYIAVPANKYRDSVDVSDEEVNAYYQNNAKFFEAPASADIEYIALTKAGLLDSIEVSDDEIAQAYEDLQAEWALEEQRALSIIVLKSSSADYATRLAAVEKGIANNEDFAELAKQYSEDKLSAGNGGTLGFVSPGSFDEAFDAMAFTMNVGEVKGPIMVNDRNYFIKVTEIKESPNKKSFAEAQPQARDRAAAVKVEDVLLEKEDLIQNLVFDSATLEEMAAETDLPVQTASKVLLTGGFGWMSDPDFVQTLNTDEALNDKELMTTKLNNGDLVVFRVVAHELAAIKPLDSVRQTIIDTLKREGSMKQVATELNEKIQQIKDGKTSLADVATSYGADVVSHTGLLRTDNYSSQNETGADYEVLKSAFQMPQPKADTEITYHVAEKRSGDQVLIALKRVDTPQAVVDKALSQKLMQSQMSQEGEDLLALMRKKVKIKEFNTQ